MLPLTLSTREYEKFCQTKDGKVSVRVCSEDGGFVTTEFPGDFFYIDSVDQPLSADTQTTIISYTVPAGKKLFIGSFLATCRTEMLAEIFIDGSKVGSCRTAPGRPEINFPFRPIRAVSAGLILEVKLTARAGFSGTTLADGYIQGSLVTL